MHNSVLKQNKRCVRLEAALRRPIVVTSKYRESDSKAYGAVSSRGTLMPSSQSQVCSIKSWVERSSKVQPIREKDMTLKNDGNRY